MVTYYFFKLGVFLTKFIPRRNAYFVANICGYIAYFILIKKRKIVISNLKIILKNKSYNEILKVGRKIFQNYTKYFFDLLYISHLCADDFSKLIKKENNIEEIKKNLGENKGIIIATGHIGHWDLGAMYLASLGYKISAIAEVLKPYKLFKFYTNLRTKQGVNIIPLGISLDEIYKKLKNNEIIALLSDRIISGKGIKVEFFSKKIIFPAGAVTIALRTKAILIPAFIIRNKNNTYSPIIEDPLCLEIKKEIKETIQINTQKLTKIIEKIIMQYPEQWYMLQPLKISS